MQSMQDLVMCWNVQAAILLLLLLQTVAWLEVGRKLQFAGKLGV
jgi:hypothetical protein